MSMQSVPFRDPPTDAMYVHACGDLGSFGPPSEADACCLPAAVYGDRCDCWEPVLDLERTDTVQEGPAGVQERRCHDCAYRRDSPEHADGTPLPRTADQGPFQCHQGMPRVVEWHHPSGARLCAWPRTTGDYEPIKVARGRSWQADGTPALLCAGWAMSAGVHPRRLGVRS